MDWRDSWREPLDRNARKTRQGMPNRRQLLVSLLCFVPLGVLSFWTSWVMMTVLSGNAERALLSERLQTATFASLALFIRVLGMPPWQRRSRAARVSGLLAATLAAGSLIWLALSLTGMLPTLGNLTRVVILTPALVSIALQYLDRSPRSGAVPSG